MSAITRICPAFGSIKNSLSVGRRLLSLPSSSRSQPQLCSSLARVNQRWLNHSSIINNSNSDNTSDATEAKDGVDLLESLKENNEFYEKYKAKLEAADLSKKTEVESIPDAMDELQQKMKRVAEESKNKAAMSPTGKLLADGNSEIQSLDSIVKTEKLQELSVDAIALLWKQYHLEKESIGAVIPTEIYDKLRDRAKHNPNFLFPLPRDEGFEIYFGQWKGHQFAFTSMLEYKTHADNAPPYLLLNHYVELAESKDVVLMSGELDENMSVFDAQLIANQIQMFYLGDDAAFKLVETFNHRPTEFNYQDVIDKIDTLGMSASK